MLIVILPFDFFHKLREKIARQQQNRSEQFCGKGKIELDESYFGGVRKGKCGRGAAGKIPVFGILKRGGKVYTQIIDNTQRETLLPIIRKNIKHDSIVYTDNYHAYNALDVSEFKHYRVTDSDFHGYSKLLNIFFVIFFNFSKLSRVDQGNLTPTPSHVG